MPYKDPEKYREWRRKHYAANPDYREKEAERKAKWFQDNDERKAKMREYSRQWRKRKASESGQGSECNPDSP